MKKAKETALELADMGLSLEKIAKAVKVNPETVKGCFFEMPMVGQDKKGNRVIVIFPLLSRQVEYLKLSVDVPAFQFGV